MTTAGITGDVHLVGGPSTMQAFRQIGARGGRAALLTLKSTRSFPDGVIEGTHVL